jgi:hypothetical protein
MDVRFRWLAAAQQDLVAAWQLLDLGWTRAMVKQHRRDQCWRTVHSGVYALTRAPLTQEQLWMAATLTAPQSYLSHASAGAYYGIWQAPTFQTITRPGTRGRQQHDGLLISYSKTLDGDTIIRNGIPITSPERTTIDLAAHGDPARIYRESLRLKLTTPYSLAVSLEKHRGRRGTASLNRLNDHYSGIPYSRCRSDAEAKALEILHDAGAPPPQVNVRINREEADLSWPDHKRIIEIDGPQYHQFEEEDARKQRAWEAVGYTVKRISSDDIYGAPAQLIALIPRL